MFLCSLNCLHANVWPEKRHDGSEWSSQDKRSGRHAKHGKIGVNAMLRQIRGDWAWYKQMFGFSGWASTNMCWMCHATQPTGPFPYTDFSSSSGWRKTKHTMASFSRGLRLNKIIPSPLFSAPGFLWSMIMIDVLHALDLGVSQVTLGNLFYEFWRSPLSKAKNRQLKTVELWNLIKDYYKIAKPPTRINALTVEMVKQDGKGPKFRGKGAETRHMVPFGVVLAEQMATAAGGDNVFYNQLLTMMGHLLNF